MKILLQICLFSAFTLSALATKKATVAQANKIALLAKHGVVISPKKPRLDNLSQISLPPPPDKPKNLSQFNHSVLDNLLFKEIRIGFYPCGLPISRLAGILTWYQGLQDEEKNQLVQIAIEFDNCCSVDSDLWWIYKGYNEQEQALFQTCELTQKRQNLTFVNALKEADFLSTCPSLAEYINTMTEPFDSRLGVLLIIEKAKEQNCNYTQLYKIKTAVEEKRKSLLQEKYSIDYRLFWLGTY